MTLILSNDDVAKLLTMRDCINVLEDTYAELSNGLSVNRVRSDCLVPSGQDEALYSLKSMDGVAPKLGVGAVRLRPAFPLCLPVGLRSVLAGGEAPQPPRSGGSSDPPLRTP